jgi:hypothetical protein
VWLVVLALLLVLDRLARSRPRVDGLFRSFAVAVMLLVLIGVTIDLAIGASVPALTVAPESAEPG